MDNNELAKENLSQLEQDLQRLAEFTLLDDDFMTAVFSENIPGVQYVLEVILGLPDLKIEKVEVQRTIKNLRGRSIRLDIYAVDNANKRYNIEVQTASRGASLKRVRYYSSLMDAELLDVGEDFSRNRLMLF